MVAKCSKRVEQALVDLAYAQAELTLKGGDGVAVARVLAHIRHAQSRLKVLAPDFESLARHRDGRAA